MTALFKRIVKFQLSFFFMLVLFLSSCRMSHHYARLRMGDLQNETGSATNKPDVTKEEEVLFDSEENDLTAAIQPDSPEESIFNPVIITESEFSDQKKSVHTERSAKRLGSSQNPGSVLDKSSSLHEDKRDDFGKAIVIGILIAILLFFIALSLLTFLVAWIFSPVIVAFRIALWVLGIGTLITVAIGIAAFINNF